MSFLEDSNIRTLHFKRWGHGSVYWQVWNTISLAAATQWRGFSSPGLWTLGLVKRGVYKGVHGRGVQTIQYLCNTLMITRSVDECITIGAKVGQPYPFLNEQ